MKKISLIFILFSLSIFGYSQKCKYDFEKKDEFSGKTSAGFINNINKSLSFQMVTDGDNQIISLSISFPGVIEDFISIGDTMMIAIENKQPLIFISNSSALPTLNANSMGVFSYIQSIYPVTIDQLQTISENNITAIKFYVNKNTKFYSSSVPEKKAKKLSNNAKCLVNYKK